MTIGATSAIAAAVLKIFKLIIVGSICGIRPNHFRRLAFPSLRTDRAPALKLSDRNCTRDEQIAPVPRQFAAKNRRKYGWAKLWPVYCQVSPQLAIRVWTIRRADGITALRLLELAEPS
jgi:hypothetical protein